MEQALPCAQPSTWVHLDLDSTYALLPTPCYLCPIFCYLVPCCLRPVPYALLPMPNYLCPVTYALFLLTYLSPVPYALVPCLMPSNLL